MDSPIIGYKFTVQYELNGYRSDFIKSRIHYSSIVTPDRDEDTGKFSTEYPAESFIQAVNELDTATTSKVAEKVGCSYDLAYRRLRELVEEGALKKVSVGGSFVWQRSE